MDLFRVWSGMDILGWRGMAYTVLLLNFVFACQLLFLQPLVSTLDGQSVEAAELYERASQSIKVKRYSDALDDLHAAIEADPALSEAYFKRASVLRHFCRYEDSENNYQKYLEFKSGDSNAEKELSQLHQAKSALETASTLYESKDIAKALEFVDKVVLVFSPACSKAKLLKVKLLMVSKDYSAVISETGYILKEDENNLEALLLRGRAYYYLADHDIAQRHYQKGLRLDPEHSELKKAYFGLKKLLKKTKSAEDNANKGKLRVSAEEYKEAIALDPEHTANNVHLYLGLCKVSVRLGRGKDGLNSCNEALNIDGELIEALHQRGEAKLLLEDWEGAVEDLKQAAQNSQDMEIHEALGRAEKALKMSKRKDWYKILGISKTASISEIKRAYKKLALQWHPDKNVDNREEAENKFREIAAAYEILGDDDKRARFDRGEDLEDMGGGGGGGFNPFHGGGGGGQQYTFHFEGGFPGGGGGFGGFGF
ncbi:PREDICTED: dnaJ protein P58IPK homolog [Camelina sativa]|uniref:DnaJ protein P58IPK homolog n=1 Tax=Camelina sativa TaxID=90675 RepID=A0ABM0TBJ8_CAMSA|nr:PREDICTED: dnaJ protein P58IPK homolog [Camelina sativa]